MHGSAQPGSAEPEDTSGSIGPLRGHSNGSGALAESELDSTLQLLVERAQYITGATGTALALPQGEEMICRASAGSSAPAIGARLQVQSGLTGESISRRQLLRCDNAETDPRVNLEACRSLGIASIVVLPLLRPSGEVRGLFELFSDHPYAFEERDLIALERMAALTLTALDMAEQGYGTALASSQTAEMRIERYSVAPPIVSPLPPPSPTVPPLPKNEIIGAAIKTEAGVESNRIESIKEIPSAPTEPASSHAGSPTASTFQPVAPAAMSEAATPQAAAILPDETSGSVSASGTLPPEEKVTAENESPALEQQRITESISSPSRVPEAMRRVQKCASCGFPVSSGRTVCIDCERKELHDKELRGKELRDKEKASAKTNAEKIEHPEPKPAELQDKAQVEASSAEISDGVIGDGAIADIASESAPEASDEFVPAFLANAAAAKESWLSNHVNLLAIVVLIMAILVAVVVFR
jgi:hypothetical protein